MRLSFKTQLKLLTRPISQFFHTLLKEELYNFQAGLCAFLGGVFLISYFPVILKNFSNNFAFYTYTQAIATTALILFTIAIGFWYFDHSYKKYQIFAVGIGFFVFLIAQIHEMLLMDNFHGVFSVVNIVTLTISISMISISLTIKPKIRLNCLVHQFMYVMPIGTFLAITFLVFI